MQVLDRRSTPASTARGRGHACSSTTSATPAIGAAQRHDLRVGARGAGRAESGERRAVSGEGRVRAARTRGGGARGAEGRASLGGAREEDA